MDARGIARHKSIAASMGRARLCPSAVVGPRYDPDRFSYSFQNGPKFQGV